MGYSLFGLNQVKTGSSIPAAPAHGTHHLTVTPFLVIVICYQYGVYHARYP